MKFNKIRVFGKKFQLIFSIHTIDAYNQVLSEINLISKTN